MLGRRAAELHGTAATSCRTSMIVAMIRDALAGRRRRGDRARRLPAHASAQADALADALARARARR